MTADLGLNPHVHVLVKKKTIFRFVDRDSGLPVPRHSASATKDHQKQSEHEPRTHHLGGRAPKLNPYGTSLYRATVFFFRSTYCVRAMNCS
jgi:hypothetical protein